MSFNDANLVESTHRSGRPSFVAHQDSGTGRSQGKGNGVPSSSNPQQGADADAESRPVNAENENSPRDPFERVGRDLGLKNENLLRWREDMGEDIGSVYGDVYDEDRSGDKLDR